MGLLEESRSTKISDGEVDEDKLAEFSSTLHRANLHSTGCTQMRHLFYLRKTCSRVQIQNKGKAFS
jgi:hypothetical protein